jgi:TonB family protein
LATALILSAFLHLGLIFWPAIDLLRFDRSIKGAQVVLQATIRPLPTPNTPQASKVPHRTRKAADRARADASADAAKSTSQKRPETVTSVELGKPANSAPENPEDSPDRASARQRAEPDPQAGQLAPQQPEEASAGPENREPIFIQDPGTPVYPREAMQRGLESCVLAAAYISPLGEVDAVRILHTDIPEVFDQSVIDAHSAARYLPARQHGQNLPSRVLAVVSFVLEPDRTRDCAFKYAPAARRINALPVSAEIGPGFVEEALRATQ